MPDQTRIVSPGPGRSVRAADNQILHPPADWVLVAPGDPALTRRIKAAGPTWTVQEIRRRKIFSRGVWALGSTVERIRQELAAERATPKYAKKREAGTRRREQEQAEYVRTFRRAVLDFLAFHPRYTPMAEALAHAVTAHATPVGSGTVARTERIAVHDRAEAAVIAWMRHRTTAYERLTIPRVKGKRREIRRMLAAQSKDLLAGYRAGREVHRETCPLERALTATTDDSVA
jgi:hypothetical protein